MQAELRIELHVANNIWHISICHFFLNSRGGGKQMPGNLQPPGGLRMYMHKCITCPLIIFVEGPAPVFWPLKCHVSGTCL
jgi:hypothetical protein